MRSQKAKLRKLAKARRRTKDYEKRRHMHHNRPLPRWGAIKEVMDPMLDGKGKIVMEDRPVVRRVKTGKDENGKPIYESKEVGKVRTAEYAVIEKREVERKGVHGRMTYGPPSRKYRLNKRQKQEQRQLAINTRADQHTAGAVE